MIRALLFLCAIFICVSIYGLFVGEFTPSEFKMNIGLIFFTSLLLVIACMINVNGF